MHTGFYTISLIVIYLITSSTLAPARTNTIDTGISLAYDYNNREYETTIIDGVEVGGGDDDYQDIVINPLIHFISAGIKDNLEIRVSPSIQYDTIDAETDWNNDFYIGANKYLSKSWRIIGSNSLIRSDFHETDSTVDSDSSSLNTPELSGDFGRTRYWRNSFSLDSEHVYDQESILSFGLDYILLRNDESDLRSYDNYDRYVLSINNEHRFNQLWNLTSDLSFIRGDFETVGATELLSEEDDISDDLREYHFLTNLKHNYSRQSVLVLSYNYIGTRHDEDIRIDGDIHQSRLTWTYLLSRKSTLAIGAGPSYEKSEGREGNIGGNGTIQYDYQGQRTNVNFGVEKIYGIENFSGTDERGFIDYWNTYLNVDYQVTPSLLFNGQARYRYEDREDSSAIFDDTEFVSLQEYNTETWIIGLGVSYSFLRDYTISLDYTYTDQDSERIGDTYTDHRFLASISWSTNWFRW